MTLLVLLIVLPLIGAAAASKAPRPVVKTVALAFSLLTLAVGVLVAVQFYDAGAASLDLNGMSAPSIGFAFNLGVNGVGLWLMVLTVAITPLAVAASFDSIKDRQREYYAWMLVLLAVMNGVFVARDALLFYVFFELTLVPMFFIIGIWGGPERRYAANKFFLFTFAGGVLTLATLIFLGSKYGTFDIPSLVKAAQQGLPSVNGRAAAAALTYDEKLWVFLGFLAGFGVKVPLFPVHTWLPLAHTEAPTAGSVILAGVLLKLGTYGILAVAVPIGLVNADGSAAFPDLIKGLGVICVIGVIYGALVAWVQQDIKKLVAYSSVSHLGFCVLGMLALNDIGMQASVLYMINHGISTGAMFLCIGFIYDRYHTRDIDALSGLARRMPVLAFFFVFFAMSSIGLPGLNGFVSEFFTIQGAFVSPYLGKWFAAFAATGVVLGAIYMLHMTAKVIMGPLKTPDDHGGGHGHGHGDAHGHGGHGHATVEDRGQGVVVVKHDDHGHKAPGDLTFREIGILVPLALAAIVLGVKPGLVSDSMQAPIAAIRGGTAPKAPAAAPAPAPAAPAHGHEHASAPEASPLAASRADAAATR
ncbi:MAG TPA: NADH-quinone oxidoreductase subunit M [Humisphaera sp.]